MLWCFAFPFSALLRHATPRYTTSLITKVLSDPLIVVMVVSSPISHNQVLVGCTS